MKWPLAALFLHTVFLQARVISVHSWYLTSFCLPLFLLSAVDRSLSPSNNTSISSCMQDYILFRRSVSVFGEFGMFFRLRLFVPDCCFVKILPWWFGICLLFFLVDCLTYLTFYYCIRIYFGGVVSPLAWILSCPKASVRVILHFYGKLFLTT